MDGFWKILELEPTRDVSAIKRAYAQKTKTCHPEENPEGFLELRKAYQAAMAYAEQGSKPPLMFFREQKESKEEKLESSSQTIDWMPAKEGSEYKNETEETVGWLIPDELPKTETNPFCNGEAIRKFMELYTGKQRKNSKLWMDYFTSDAFLDAAWDSRFTALLLEKVTEVEQEFPLNKEFMMWLGIAYQFSVKEEQISEENRERQVRLYQGADFAGIESILCIADKGPLPKRAGGDELAVLESFKNYRHLVRMAEGGSWNEQAMEEFQWIANRYSSAYIKEHCDPKANLDYQCHPVGLRVFFNFFQRSDLPEELYRIVWQKYNLKSAVMGRMKIFYGPLRELVTKRIPDIEEETPENFLRLNQERIACFSRIQANPQLEQEELEVFLAKESVKKALRSRRFVEEQLLSASDWLNNVTPERVVCWLKEFYEENQDISGWNRVVERAEKELNYRAKERERKEKAKDAIPAELDFSLLSAMPERVYVQPLTGREYLVQPEEEFEMDWESLLALFDRFAEGELMRLELEFYQTTLVLIRDGDKYACFCFETGYDTWYSMLSKPEVYQRVDSKDVEYLSFGMGKLASYNIHESPDSILRNLNLVFMQIGRGSIHVRIGDDWLWSSHTSQQNGQLKKRMAMQKLARIPAHRAEGSILAKFVFSKHPAWVESVSLSGERTLLRLQPGNYDLAAAALAEFFQQKLAKLRLSWESKDMAEGRHMILLQDNGQFMMAWLQDGKEQASFYASDAPRVFFGRVYPACLVHQDLNRIRNCLDLMLDDMDCAELVTERQGEFVPMDCPYTKVREAFVDETM